MWEDQIKAYAIYSPSADGLSTSADALSQWIVDYQITMTVLADWEGDVYRDWDIDDPDSYAPYPREFIIDKQGNVAYIDSNIDVEALNATIEAALNQ